MNATVKEFLQAARLEGLLYEPREASPPLRHPATEYAFLHDALVRGVAPSVLEAFRPDDFAESLARMVFAELKLAEGALDVDELIQALSDRLGAGRRGVIDLLRPLLVMPYDYASTVEAKARAVGALGAMRRLGRFIAGKEAGLAARAARALTVAEFGAEAEWAELVREIGEQIAREG
ncbi:MAG: hypothetical protein IT374_17545 [Polyangiaceae bacterium]|nr:hypothetical protein [Polyangiaceae bacterium]